MISPFFNLIKFIGLFTGIFLVLERVIRQLTGIGNIDSFAENALMSLLFSLLFYYSTKPFKIILSLFLLASLLIESSNAVFFGGWIEPMNLYLLFENIPEVINTAIQVERTIALKSVSFAVISIIAMGYLYKLSSKNRGFIGINILIVFVLFFQPIRDGILKPEKIEKRFTKDSHSLLRSFHNAYGVFFSMLISERLGNNVYASYRQAPYPQILKKPDITPNIFIYFGESLSSKYMSVYGYNKETTPNLKELIHSLPKKKLFGLSKEAIAGATATMPATVRFFHLLDRPDARKQAASFDTNLFQYAQKSGYKTTYISTQAEHYINHIYKLATGKYVDQYLSPAHLDHANGARKDIDDAMMIKTINTRELGEPYFAVAQPNGSHTPFATRSLPAFKPFGSDSELAEYENSIFYTDNLLKKLINIISNKSDRPWIFIITSDHGNYVDESRITRSIKYPASYTVPAIILTNNQPLYHSHIQPLEKCNTLYHQNIGEMIARLLGFDAPVSNCSSGVLFTGLLNGMGAQSLQESTTGEIQMKPYSSNNND